MRGRGAPPLRALDRQRPGDLRGHVLEGALPRGHASAGWSRRGASPTAAIAREADDGHHDQPARAGRRWRSSSREGSYDRHLRRVVRELDLRLAGRRTALDAPPAAGLALHASRRAATWSGSRCRRRSTTLALLPAAQARRRRLRPGPDLLPRRATLVVAPAVGRRRRPPDEIERGIRALGAGRARRCRAAAARRARPRRHVCDSEDRASTDFTSEHLKEEVTDGNTRTHLPPEDRAWPRC